MGLDRLYLHKSERRAREDWTGEDDEGDIFKSSRGFVVDRREHEDFGTAMSMKAKREAQRKNRNQFDIPSALLESDLVHDLIAVFIAKPILYCAGMLGGKPVIQKWCS